MAVKEIVWSNVAKAELANVLELYSERNGSAKYSLKLLDEVEDLMRTLIQNENLGRLTSNKFTRIIPMKSIVIELKSFHFGIPGKIRREAE